MRKIVRDRILERDNYQCVGCGSNEKLCIDHIFPLSKGGKENESNMQVLCRSCNSKKSAKIPYEKFLKVGYCDKQEDYFLLTDKELMLTPMPHFKEIHKHIFHVLDHIEEIFDSKFYPQPTGEETFTQVFYSAMV